MIKQGVNEMENLYQKAITEKNKYVDQLLLLDDVHTVAVGHKQTDDIMTKIPAIVIFTTKKKRMEDIPENQRIPKTINGVPTDIVELPKFKNSQSEEAIDMPNRRKYRPIPGGAEIYMPSSPFTGGYCTLGMFAHSTRPSDSAQTIYLLSCAHCFYRPDQVIFQPESNDPIDRIAYATRFVNSTHVDGGIAELLDNDLAAPCEIIGIGSPLGTYDVSVANLGELVVKSGRTTGTTVGAIAYLNADADDKKDQIIIIDQNNVTFSDHGDSGSVVLMDQGPQRHKVIGLLWGGALQYTILSPIRDVLNELEISLIFAKPT